MIWRVTLTHYADGDVCTDRDFTADIESLSLHDDFIDAAYLIRQANDSWAVEEQTGERYRIEPANAAREYVVRSTGVVEFVQ